ncbi:acyltransferase family protein [Flavobacterium sp.]|uniref:acyltransferase family protein n=1 Tax=Flavobacterium sp. TaxID=239 RepID=UPI00374CA04A
MKVLPNITSLRFFLAIIVVVFHLPEFCSKHNIPFYNFLPIFHKGSEAVNVFFSLSGFLIIRQLYVEKKTTNSVSLKKFFLRRVLRIFPLYFLILSFGLVYYNVILPKFGFPFESNYNLYKGLLLSLFFLPNVFAVLYSPGGIIEVLWSIGVEEQFYLFIAPVVLLLPTKKIILFLVLFTFTFFCVFFYEQTPLFRKFGMYFFYFTSSGFFSILILKKTFLSIHKTILYVLCFIFIIYFTTDIFIDYFSIEAYHFFSMMLFSTLISFMTLSPLKILENNVSIYLGKISYGIYMYHSIVIQFVGLIYLKVFSKFYLDKLMVIVVYNCVVITITIFISHFSYKYYELYFIKKKIH